VQESTGGRATVGVGLCSVGDSCFLSEQSVGFKPKLESDLAHDYGGNRTGKPNSANGFSRGHVRWDAQRATLVRSNGQFVVCRNFNGTRQILMQIHVLFFGVLKDLVGRSSESLDLPEDAQVRDVLAYYARQVPKLGPMLPALAFSVNQEYSTAERVLAAGDELALLPPVSGGAPAGPRRGEVRIVHDPIPTSAVVAALKRPEDGAAVIFEGIVRDNSRGRRTLYLDYEAYEPMALQQMKGLVEQARERFEVAGVSILHRLGRLEIGETSVLVAVASAHRAAAFEACRWIIDTLKKTVPIWKKEYFEDGAVWADGEPFPEEIQQPDGTIGPKPASK